MSRSPETHAIAWRGITIEIGYDPEWLGISAHLDITTVAPERAALPITETGYRSHFASQIEIAEAGGPIAFVIAWLDQAAQAQDWKDRQDSARQMTLF